MLLDREWSRGQGDFPSESEHRSAVEVLLGQAIPVEWLENANVLEKGALTRAQQRARRPRSACKTYFLWELRLPKHMSRKSSLIHLPSAFVAEKLVVHSCSADVSTQTCACLQAQVDSFCSCWKLCSADACNQLLPLLFKQNHIVSAK